MDDHGWDAVRAGYGEAARWFAATTARVGGRWEDPALGEWTVRDLTGHTSRALLTVETYLDAGAAAIEIDSPEEYYRGARASLGDPGAVAKRGRDAGGALGADPVATVGRIVERVTAVLAQAAPDAGVGTPVGGMRLDDYLPTRTFELIVHTCDLAAALDIEPQPPARPAAQVLALIGGMATLRGTAAPLLAAATGRGPLPAGYSVL